LAQVLHILLLCLVFLLPHYTALGCILLSFMERRSGEISLYHTTIMTMA